jgi:hypothetical protein
MKTRLSLLTVLALLVAATPASATIVPNEGMAGVKLGDCIERAIDVLGPPDRTFGSNDFAGFKESYSYDKSALKLEFRRGAGACLELTSIRTRSGVERTKEGVGKGTRRKALRAKLKGEKCRTFKRPKRISICWLGSMTPSKPLTEFRIDSKGRVNNVRIGIVID